MTDVAVTQEDRDAAADLAVPVYGQRIADRIRNGEIKRHHFIDAFSRHRQSSTEEVERLREALERMSEAMERDGDPAYAHLIMDARAALTGVKPHDD